jgi:hypothetical protein
MPVTRYEDDLYRWAQETAQAIRERRFDEIDIEHVADEVLDVGKSDLRALRSQIERILLHLMKIRYQPNKETRSWTLTIEEARARAEQSFEESPSFRRMIDDLLPKAYRTARLQTIRQTGLAPDVFPPECPFSVDDVLGPNTQA